VVVRDKMRPVLQTLASANSQCKTCQRTAMTHLAEQTYIRTCKCVNLINKWGRSKRLRGRHQSKSHQWYMRRQCYRHPVDSSRTRCLRVTDFHRRAFIQGTSRQDASLTDKQARTGLLRRLATPIITCTAGLAAASASSIYRKALTT